MGAWGIGAFENDDALDFVDEVSERGFVVVVKALERVTATGEAMVEAPEATIGIAAAELVARLLGPDPDDAEVPELSGWLGAQTTKPKPETVALAKRAMERVLTPPSEIVDLWMDSEHQQAWRDEIEFLISRLTPA